MGGSPEFSKSLQCRDGLERCGQSNEAGVFLPVVVEPIYEEMKDLQEAHDSREEALRDAYGYEELKGRGLYEFEQWVSSMKTH